MKVVCHDYILKYTIEITPEERLELVRLLRLTENSHISVSQAQWNLRTELLKMFGVIP